MAGVKAVNMHKRRAMGENITGMKKGGAVRDSSDEAQDKALVKKMVKPEAMKKGMKKGGRC